MPCRKNGSNRNTLRRALAQIGLAACAFVSGVCVCACEGDNSCKKDLKIFLEREYRCYGTIYGPVPDEVECTLVDAASAECRISRCYTMPCDGPSEEYNICMTNCGPL